MRFGVLGPITAWDGEGHQVAIPGAKVRALMALLLIHRGKVVSADKIADALWGAEPPAKVEAVLRSKASQLRQVIKRAGGDAGSMLRWESGGYRLEVDEEWTDAGRFEALVAHAGPEATRQSALELLASAEQLWRGDPFGEFRHERFAMAAAGELEETRLGAWERRVELRIEHGEAAAVVGEIDRAAAEHPLRERVHVLLMRCLYQTGRQSEAMDVYRRLAERLGERLGVDPGPEAAECYTEILRQERPIVKPEPTAEAPRAGMPAPLTPLVAREAESRELAGLIERSRLVTLTGPGGVGKTRLAVEAARRAGESFPDGAVFADLGAVRGGEDEVLRALAEPLGVRDDASAGVESPGLAYRLYSAVLTKRMLLVVDNCEQAVGPIAAVVAELLHSGPELRVIATSRSPLDVPGERVMALGPLSFPDGDQAADPEAFGAYRLFDHLVRTAGGTVAAPETALRICRRLDGLPLALELAAVRVRSLGAEEVDRRLEDRFRLLGGGKRSGADRHRTLEAAIDWSWNLADEEQRRALRRLSYLEDWSLEAAEALCGPEVDVLETIPALVDQSLVALDQYGRARYCMLESVRAFGLDRLRESGEESVVASRLLDHARGLVARWTPRLRGPGQSEALTVLRDESPNLRLALRTCEDPLPLVLDLMWFWALTGRLTEAREALRSAMDRADPESAAAWAGRCWAEVLRLRTAEDGDAAGPEVRLEAVPDAGGSLGESVRLAAWLLSTTRTAMGIPPGEPVPVVVPDGAWGAAAATLTDSMAAMLADDVALARERAEESLAGFESVGDRWGEIQAVDLLSRAANEAGAGERADLLDRRSLEAAEALGLDSDRSRALSRMGRRALARGEVAEAELLYEQARRVAGEQCDALVCAEAEGGLRAVREAAAEPVEAGSREWLRILALSDLHADPPEDGAVAA